MQHDPGTYSFTYATFDSEGTWHWNVTATDDLGRTSTIDRAFRYDTTLRGLEHAEARTRHGDDPLHPRAARHGAAANRDDDRRPRARRAAGQPRRRARDGFVWDGRLPHGSRAYGGSYVAHLFVDELGRHVRALCSVLLQAHRLGSAA